MALVPRMASSVTVDHMPQQLISPRRYSTGRVEEEAKRQEIEEIMKQEVSAPT